MANAELKVRIPDDILELFIVLDKKFPPIKRMIFYEYSQLTYGFHLCVKYIDRLRAGRKIFPLDALRFALIKVNLLVSTEAEDCYWEEDKATLYRIARKYKKILFAGWGVEAQINE